MTEAALRSRLADIRCFVLDTVSYTHLTLPTTVIV